MVSRHFLKVMSGESYQPCLPSLRHCALKSKIVEKYPYDMDMKRGRYIVDAKSLLGLMNLGFDHEIELNVYDEDCDDLWKELDKFVAA